MMKAIVQPTFKRYPAYKDSGVEWLGEIPEGWGSLKMKLLFRDFSEKGRPNAILLSVTQNKGVIPRETVENRMVMPTGNLDTFKYIQRGDFAISLRSFEGGLELCHSDGIISPAYTVLKAKRNLVNQYFKYLFKSFSFISEIQTSVVGIREGKNISFSELSYSILPLPTLNEQQTIARFLDEKTAQIDNAIAIKERQIAVLKERQQVLIQQAVTKGLDPDVPMKDSGVEWIGEIPAHWEVKRLKYLVQNSFSGGTPSTDIQSYWNGGIPWISSVDIKADVIHETTREISITGLLRSSSRIAPKGSIVFVTRSGILQHTFAISTLSREMAINQDIKCLILNTHLHANYFKKLVQGNNSEILTLTRQQGATVESINTNDLFNLEFPIPPLNEQIEIHKFIDAISNKFNELSSIFTTEIEKLKEYKTSLIDRVVTGKVKVS